MKIELPDAVEDQQPNYCRECGRGLSGIEGSVEFEKERVGFHVIPLTTRHRFLSKACTCGCRNRLDVPQKRKIRSICRTESGPWMSISTWWCTCPTTASRVFCAMWCTWTSERAAYEFSLMQPGKRRMWYATEFLKPCSIAHLLRSRPLKSQFLRDFILPQYLAEIGFLRDG